MNSKELREAIVRIIHDCENDTCETCSWFKGIVGCQEPMSGELMALLSRNCWLKSEIRAVVPPILMTYSPEEREKIIDELYQVGWRPVKPIEARNEL